MVTASGAVAGAGIVFVTLAPDGRIQANISLIET
jgi:hypothetical protein